MSYCGAIVSAATCPLAYTEHRRTLTVARPSLTVRRDQDRPAVALVWLLLEEAARGRGERLRLPIDWSRTETYNSGSLTARRVVAGPVRTAVPVWNRRRLA